MAEERDPVVIPSTSPLVPELPVTTALTSSELDDDPTRGTAVGTYAAPLPGSIDDGRSASLGAAASTTAADTDDPEVIRTQIERTREDMSATLNELQERLSPQHIAQQAKDSVREATVGRVQQFMGTAGERASDVASRAQTAAGTAAEQVREHPIPVALAGAGAGLVWWLMRRQSRRPWSDNDMYEWDDADVSYERDYATLEVRSDEDWSGQGSTGRSWTRVLLDNPVPASIAAASIGYMLWSRRSNGWSDDDGVGVRSAYAYGDDVVADDTSASRTGARVTETARDMSRQAREKAGAIGEQVSDTVRSAQTRATQATRDVSRRLRSASSQTSTQFDRWMRENPLAVGVAALAAGAVVGLSVPRTQTENQVMGASRDALLDRATDSAQQIKDQVREKVQSVASDLTKGQQDTDSPAFGTTPPTAGV